MNIIEQIHKKVNTPIASLIAVNLLPIFGVIFLNWNTGTLLFSYRTESAIIGFYTILKIKKTANKEETITSKVILFFMIHFWWFMLGHFIFLYDFFDLNLGLNLNWIEIGIFFICLLISHGVSFVTNFLKKQEYKKTNVGKLFIAPYPRIVIMHLVITASGFLVMGKATGLVIILVIIKTVVDAISHTIVHKRYFRNDTNDDETNNITQVLNLLNTQHSQVIWMQRPSSTTSPTQPKPKKAWIMTIFKRILKIIGVIIFIFLWILILAIITSTL